MEAARSDAPDAFQGLFAALEEACRGKRLSVDQRRGNQRRGDGVRVRALVDAATEATSRRWRGGRRDRSHTGGRGQLRRGLAVLRRRARGRRLRGRRGAVPRRGARRRVRGVPALPRRARGHGAARRPRRLRRLRGFGRDRSRGRRRAAAPRGGPVDRERRGGRRHKQLPHVRDGVAAGRRVARVEGRRPRRRQGRGAVRPAAVGLPRRFCQLTGTPSTRRKTRQRHTQRETRRWRGEGHDEKRPR